MAAPLLEIEDLHVEFPTQNGVMHAVQGVSISLDEGDVLGIVGESGSGKSVSMLALMGLVAYPGRIRAKRLQFAGHDLLQLSDRARRKVIGGEVAMIFQEPTTSLNPCFTIGFQLAETLQLHLDMDRKAARKRSIELLELVGIPAPESRLGDFPHQMSGGMRQRVLIAMALACRPSLVIADEPTTALDVTIQAQILELLADLQKQFGTSILLITHDLGVVAETASRVIVMYGGEIVEEAPVRELFAAAHHPYTEGLLGAMPQVGQERERLATIPGTVPPPTAWPSGCRFHDRCPYAWDRCAAEHPPLYQIGNGHVSRCHLADEPQRRAEVHEPLVAVAGDAGVARRERKA